MVRESRRIVSPSRRGFAGLPPQFQGVLAGIGGILPPVDERSLVGQTVAQGRRRRRIRAGGEAKRPLELRGRFPV